MRFRHGGGNAGQRKSDRRTWLENGMLVISCLTMACGFGAAQGVGSSGDIQGLVADPSGAFVPHASVSVVDESRGLRRSTLANDTGNFDFAGLAPASYTVTAEAAGFSKLVERHVVVEVNERVSLNLALQLAATSTEVVVDVKRSAVDTQQTSQAGYIGREEINNLPINRRDYLSFALLLPGTVW